MELSGLSDFKITDGDLAAKGVIAAPDKLTGTAAQNKVIFDRLVGEVVKEKFNGMLTALETDISEYLGQTEQERRAAEETRAANENARIAAEAARNVWEEYDDAKTYQPGNKVVYGGSSYICISQSAGNTPDDAAHWRIVAQKGLDGAVASFNGRTGAVVPQTADYGCFFAPGGFGLGDYGKSISNDVNLNDIVKSGWYTWWSGYPPVNAPFTYGYMLVVAGTNGYVTQFVFAADGTVVKRTLITGGGLSNWIEEWVDPPLAAGREYRTTERFLGRPVYVRVVNAGAAPDTKSPNIDYYAKILPTPIANIGAVLRCDWVTNTIGPIAQCYDYGAYAGIFAYYNNPNIIIYSKTDQSLRVTDSYVLLKYTKTSDD